MRLAASPINACNVRMWCVKIRHRIMFRSLDFLGVCALYCQSIVVFFACPSYQLSKSGTVFERTKCPSSGVTLCVVESTPTQSCTGTSLAQCAAACGSVTGCDWFNYFNNQTDGDNNGRRGLCQLFSQPQPIHFAPVESCSCYKVGLQTNRVTARDGRLASEWRRVNNNNNIRRRK